MPGAVSMHNGAQNGARTNHDRHAGLNGIHKMGDLSAAAEKRSVDATKQSAVVNGVDSHAEPDAPVPEKRTRMNDLPDEIVHIAEGFIPLSLLLSRLAQQTHNVVQEKILQLAKAPQPPAPPAVNGNPAAALKDKDEFDNTPESVSKKANLLPFIQTIHGKWVKALVIANWSRENEMIRKLIDLKSHLNDQLLQFHLRLDEVVELKRNLIFAAIPSPDLKTGLQVLSRGNGDWMPDLGYIDPPPLTQADHARWLEDIDTCLSIRLNLQEYDKIPPQFKDYSIGSGRATFKVEGEFEVDLTVADDDPEKQFWFIDFRFAFSPAASDISEKFKPLLEAHVNNALAKDGLTGCYNLLHEFVLSHKVGELQRQAYELSRTSWAGGIAVENLDRSFSIQYWLMRQPQNTSAIPTYSKYAVPQVPTTPKSWVIVSVNSGKRPDGRVDPRATSKLTAKWYRDGKEVQNTEIAFDHNDLSTERLLKVVIAKHVEHIFGSIHRKLRPAPRFANHESAITTHLSAVEPGESFLTMQLSASESVTLRMEPTTGKFTLHPPSKYSLQGENRLNNSGKDPSEDGSLCLENLRWHHLTEEITRKGRALGWIHTKSPLAHDEVKLQFKAQEPFHPVCFQRQDMDPSWFVMLVMSLRGDEWWALQAPGPKPSLRSLQFYTKLRFDVGQPDLGPGFWSNLTIFVTGVIANSVDVHELHSHELRYEKRGSKNILLPDEVVIPSVYIKFSDLLPTVADSQVQAAPNAGKLPPGHQGAERAGVRGPAPANSATGTPPSTEKQLRSPRSPWAMDFVEVKYSGVQSTSAKGSAAPRRLSCSIDAIIRVLNTKEKKNKFSVLPSRLGQDVLFNHRRGELCIRLRSRVGTSIVPALKSRLQAVDRVVESLEAMDSTNKTIQCYEVTLNKVVFTYGDRAGRPDLASETTKPWCVALDLSQPRIGLTLQKHNPHLPVLDLLTTLVNEPGGIRKLATILPMTFNVMVTLDRLQAGWKDLAKQGRGSLTVTHKVLDWITLCYDLPEGTGGPRGAKIDVRLKQRDGGLWWYLCRADKPAGSVPGPNAAGATAGQGQGHQEQPQDYFGQRLKKIWEHRNVPWRALGSGAATHVDDKALKLLNALDSTMKEAVIQWPQAAAGGGAGAGVGMSVVAPGGTPQSAPAGRVAGVHGQGQGQGPVGANPVGSRAQPVTLD